MLIDRFNNYIIKMTTYSIDIHANDIQNVMNLLKLA